MRATCLAIVDANEERSAEIAGTFEASSLCVHRCHAVDDIDACDWDGCILLVHSDMLAQTVDRLSETLHKPVVLAYASAPQAAEVVAGLDLGALDFFAVPGDGSRIRERINQIRLGSSLPRIKRRSTAAKRQLTRLSPREWQVLQLLGNGLSNKQIARELRLSPRTVEIHRKGCFRKLRVRNSAGAVRKLVEAEFSG